MTQNNTEGKPSRREKPPRWALGLLIVAFSKVQTHQRAMELSAKARSPIYVELYCFPGLTSGAE
jgi:hypothetical protein